MLLSLFKEFGEKLSHVSQQHIDHCAVKTFCQHIGLLDRNKTIPEVLILIQINFFVDLEFILRAIQATGQPFYEFLIWSFDSHVSIWSLFFVHNRRVKSVLKL